MMWLLLEFVMWLIIGIYIHTYIYIKENGWKGGVGLKGVC